MFCLTKVLDEEEEERNAKYGVDDGHQLNRQKGKKTTNKTFPSLVFGVWSP